MVFDLKKTIRKLIIVVAATTQKSRLGRYVYEIFLTMALGFKQTVKHDNLTLEFFTPNPLSRYRANTFSSKEPDTLIWLNSIPKGSVLWDIGANVGLYSIYAAKQGVKVYAFEPSPFNLELLARNIVLNRIHELITIIPIALTDRIGPGQFKMSNTVWGGALSSFGQDFDQHGNKLNNIFEYQTIGLTMDSAISFLGIPAPHFIKMDVDGIEHLILRGGVEVLKETQSVLVEINDDFLEQKTESAHRLQSAGLTLLKKCEMPNAGNQYNQWWVRK